MSDRFEHLDPTLQRRIRRSVLISGIWVGVILLQAGIFVAAKPYLDKRRQERLKKKIADTAISEETHFAESNNGSELVIAPLCVVMELGFFSFLVCVRHKDGDSR